MKNQDKSLQSDAKPKMLFNSDGFEFLLKALAVIFKIMGILLVVALKVSTVLLSSSSKNNDEDRINDVNSVTKFVPLNPLKSPEENEFDGTGYYK